MNLDKCFALKVGDRVVRVRGYFKNMDHTMIPVEPKIYTVSWKCSGARSFKETVARGFIDSRDGIWKVSTAEVDNRCICEQFETFEDYISGNYNKDIILDTKWKSLEEFLIFKADYDHQQAREAEDKRKSEALEVIKGKK
jgi:hypothetical protein